MPQLIRHVQVLYQAMVKAGTGAYVKIGTSGTGGMGLNIPYTHSEEKPSRVLLSKSALAGAHTLLLFLMARTPGGPITKEIKPAAAIAWKRIGYGEVLRGGRPVPLYDVDLGGAGAARPGHAPSGRSIPPAGRATGETLESVFIDTGENGIFSLEEFTAITTGEQMEFVTPEEIADVVARELLGGNTGHDVINALDNAVMGPTYRAGLMRHWALEKLRALEKEKGVRSVAFENLGPPRLSQAALRGRPAGRGASRTMDRGAGGARAASWRARTAGACSRDDPRRARARSSPSASPSCCPTAACCAGPSARSPPVARAHRQPRGHAGARSRPGRTRAGWTCARRTWRAGRSASTRIEAEIDGHPRRRHLLALPARPPVLGRGGHHPARQDRGLDLRHRGEGRADEVMATAMIGRQRRRGPGRGAARPLDHPAPEPRW